MHGSWDVECGRHFRLILDHFLPFYPTNPENQNFETTTTTTTKHLEISSFHRSVPRIMIIRYTLPEIWHVMDVIVIFYFGLFLAFTPLTVQKIKILKKWKKHQEISSFYVLRMIRWCTVLEIWCATDGRREGREKWVPHLKTVPLQKTSSSPDFAD